MGSHQMHQRPTAHPAAGYTQQQLVTSQRRVVAQMQVQERIASSPVRPETLRGLSRSPEPVLPTAPSVRLRKSLEVSFAKQAHEHRFQPHRAWGLWRGASQSSHPFERSGADHISKRREVRSAAVLASEHTRTASPAGDEDSRGQAERVTQPEHGRAGSRTVLHSDHTTRRFRQSQGRVRSITDEDVSHRMSEASAWDFVAQWRKVVDAAQQSQRNTLPTSEPTQGEYAMAVQSFDVQKLGLIQRKELVAMSGIPWKRIVRLQELKNDAEMSLLHHHMGLLTKVVRRVQAELSFYRQHQADTQVEGMAQLRTCIWSFDQTMGTSFSTYLVSQLQPRIRRALEGKDTAVHVPSREVTLRKRVHAATAATPLQQAGDHRVGADAWIRRLEAIAAKSGVSVAEVDRTLSDKHLGEFSPDSAVVADGSGWDMLQKQQGQADAQGNADNSEGDAIYGDLRALSWTLQLPHLLEIVNDVVDGMPEKQAQVLVLAYGLKGESKLSLKEIAKRCGMKSHNNVLYHLKKATVMMKDSLLNKHALDPADL